MGDRLTEKIVMSLAAPATGNKLYWDAPNPKGGAYTSGFGVCVTAAGNRSYILNYRTKSGRQRRFTIGSPPLWTLTAAREAAADLRRRVEAGDDPLAELNAGRAAPTMRDLAERFEREYLPSKRPSTRKSYSDIIKNDILPKLGSTKVADVEFTDIDRLHRKISERGKYIANRTVSVLSKMFSLSIRWRLRSDNPAKGVEKNHEEKRERFLSSAEIARLADALAARPGPSANAIRLLLLTGARRGEVLGAKWDQFDLETGVWIKPASATKQGKLHRIPLSAPALALLTEMRPKAGTSPFLFPGAEGKAQSDIKKFWASICGDAALEGVRVHDLRHTFASVLASSGLSLSIIGALLGHSQPATTHRYAHLIDDPLRRATERAGAVITGGDSAEVVPLNREGRPR